MSKRLGGEHGVSAVEFALLVPLIVLLLFGLVDVGRALYVQVSLQDAVQEGTLVGSFKPDDPDEIRTRAAESSDFPPLEPADITVTCPSDGIEVTATYSLDLVTPLPMFGGTLNIGSSNVGRIFVDKACVPS